MWLEFITAPVNIRFSNAALISHQTRDRSLLLTYSSPMCTKRRLCTRESRDPRHRGLSVSNGEVRTLGTTKFFELPDALIASLQLRETLHQSSDLAALLQEFAFHSLMIFHVFSLFFRSRRTLPRSTCTWFVHTRSHNIVTGLEYHNILTSFHYVCLRTCTVRTQSIVHRIYWKTVLVQDRDHEIPYIVNSSTHFSLPAGILMHMHQLWLLSAIFFAQ